MSGRNAFNPDTDDRPTYPVVKAEFGEDPARYLALDDLYLAYARIRGIGTLALLKEWQRIEAENWGRSKVMKRLNARENELADEPVPEPTPEPTPVPATDGGTVESPSEPKRPTEPDDVHPDCVGLSVGEVARISRDDATEYVWPGTPAADGPYLLRSFDAEDTERTDGPLALSQDEYRTRMDFDRDTMAVGLIDIAAPRDAATNGGDSE